MAGASTGGGAGEHRQEWYRHGHWRHRRRHQRHDAGNNLGQLTAADSGPGSAAGTARDRRDGGTGAPAAQEAPGAAGAGGTALDVFSDRLLGSANRNATTDFAAPALDAPTFRRTFAGDGFDNLTFEQGGTSVSSAIVTGAYSLVSSALDYWTQLNTTGATASAYLTTPVGVNTLNYGANGLYNLTTYNNPSGINGILAYTAVPAADVNDNLSADGPPDPARQHPAPLVRPGRASATPSPRSRARSP